MMERQDFLLAATLNQETTSMTNVLSILLPKFIRDRINAKGVFEIQENQGEVSILFCDICGFDDLIAVEKENIVNLLDSLFRGFDGLCVSNGMQKIETVGKTFMAAGGLKAVDQGTKYINQSAVKRAVQLSLEMMEYSKKFKFGQSGIAKLNIYVKFATIFRPVTFHSFFGNNSFLQYSCAAGKIIFLFLLISFFFIYLLAIDMLFIRSFNYQRLLRKLCQQLLAYFKKSFLITKKNFVSRSYKLFKKLSVGYQLMNFKLRV